MSHEISMHVYDKLEFLDSADEMLAWDAEHHNETLRFMGFFDALARELNLIPDDHPILELMPATKLLKDVLGKRPLPTHQDYAAMGGFKYLDSATDSLMGPLMLGQDLVKGNSQPTEELNSFAVKSPSLETTIEAKIFGLIGHITERKFFVWAEEQDFNVPHGWKKDMFLHSMGEIVMMQLAIGGDKGSNSKYFDLFVKSSKEGGLGWLNKKQIKEFDRKLSKFYRIYP